VQPDVYIDEETPMSLRAIWSHSIMNINSWIVTLRRIVSIIEPPAENSTRISEDVGEERVSCDRRCYVLQVL